MTSDNDMRDRIADLIDEHVYPTIMDDVAGVDRAAQAIIDEFGLTVHGDDCGYHEIHGSYDTRFEN